MSQMGKFISVASLGGVMTLTGNIGGAISGDVLGDIDILGTFPITITGTPATNTLDIVVGDASTANKGVIEIGTPIEVIQGISTTLAVVPTSLNAKLGAQTDHGVIVGNGTGGALTALAVGTTNQVLLGATGADPVWGQVDLSTSVTGTLPVGNGGTGVATITDHSLVVGSGAAAITLLGVANDGEIPIGSSAADPVLANITSARDLAITNGAGTIDIILEQNIHDTAMHGWNGSLLETASVTVTAAGGVITLSIEKSGTGNLTAVFSDGFYNWVTAPDTVTLTAGTDTTPVDNFVYLLQSTKTLTASTVGWPATEYAAVANVVCQSAASLQTDGAYKLHAYTDHVTSPTDQGHLSMINRWIRQQNATWESGVAQTLTITPNGGAADNVIFTSASGLVYQLHQHTFPAFAGTPDVYTVNDSVTPYNIVTDLNALLTDSTGASMAGKFFSLVIWGVVSESTGDCKLMVNLPGGSYNTQASLEADSQKYANFSLPTDFIGTGFLIYQMNLRHQAAASGTWTSVSNIDLRGLFPGTAAGGSTSFATEFVDTAFRILDDGDNTKELAFECSAITTATTRTITMDDRDIDMDAVATTVASDAGNAVPAAGTLTIVGAGTVSTSGAGSTITVTGTGGGISWSIITADLDPMIIDTGYICNKAGLLTVTLNTTAAVGTVQRVTGINTDLGWKIAQNANQIIHFGDVSTTTGAGGSLASTLKRDSVELVCVVADLEWNVVSSVGNITIV